MSSRTIGIREIEVRRAAVREHERVLLYGRRQARGDERLLKGELELRHRRTSGAIRQVGQPFPGGGTTTTATAQIEVDLAELGIRAQASVADVFDHREAARRIEHPTEVEDRSGHRRDAGASTNSTT